MPQTGKCVLTLEPHHITVLQNNLDISQTIASRSFATRLAAQLMVKYTPFRS